MFLVNIGVVVMTLKLCPQNQIKTQKDSNRCHFNPEGFVALANRKHIKMIPKRMKQKQFN